MQSVRFAFLGLPIVLLASCGDTSQVTAPVETHKPSFDPGSPPDTSGPNVFRFPFFAVVFSGFETELAVATGFNAPFADHCGDTPSPGQPGSAQIVLTPPGGFHLKDSGRDVSVLVFAFEGPVFDNCLLVGAPVVASGTAHVTFTVGPRQTAATVHGVVDLASGGQAKLLVTTITHFGADGSLVFDHTRIRLTPL
jgi:hypothetical protein